MSLPRISKAESTKVDSWLKTTTLGPMSWGPKRERSSEPMAEIPGADVFRTEMMHIENIIVLDTLRRPLIPLMLIALQNRLSEMVKKRP